MAGIEPDVLLLPLQGVAGLQQSRSSTSAQAARIDGAERRLVALRQAVASAASNEEINQRLQRLQGPVLGPADLAQPLPLLKAQVAAVLDQAQLQIARERQATPPTDPWRLLGGLLKLQVGYKVGGMIIVMGWLVHEGGLASWIPLRFFWTSFGVLIALLGLRLFWPARGLDSSLAQVARLLVQLQSCFRDLAARVDPSRECQVAGQVAEPVGIDRYRALRNQLVAIRQQRPTLVQELGTMPERHPATLLMANFDATASRLITLVGGLVREAPTLQDPQLVVQLHRAEAELLQAMAGQLCQWEQQIRGRRGLPTPPPRAGCSCRAAGRNWARSSTTPPPTRPPRIGWSGLPAG